MANRLIDFGAKAEEPHAHLFYDESYRAFLLTRDTEADICCSGQAYDLVRDDLARAVAGLRRLLGRASGETNDATSGQSAERTRQAA